MSSFLETRRGQVQTIVEFSTRWEKMKLLAEGDQGHGKSSHVRCEQTTYERLSCMGDCWMDTEHILLGILRVRGCTAARYLEMMGLSLASARKAIQENKPSRPDYGNIPRLWPTRRWLTLLLKWGWP
jgi:hypothetical protein